MPAAAALTVRVAACEGDACVRVNGVGLTDAVSPVVCTVERLTVTDHGQSLSGSPETATCTLTLAEVPTVVLIVVALGDRTLFS